MGKGAEELYHGQISGSPQKEVTHRHPHNVTCTWMHLGEGILAEREFSVILSP